MPFTRIVSGEGLIGYADLCRDCYRQESVLPHLAVEEKAEVTAYYRCWNGHRWKNTYLIDSHEALRMLLDGD